MSTSTDSFDDKERLLDDQQSEGSEYMPVGHTTRRMPWWRRCSMAWIFAFFSFILNAGLIFVVGFRMPQSVFGSFERGFSTDLEPAKIALEAVRMPFTGELKRHENGSLYRDMGPGPLYIGYPTPEIDHNWERLAYASGLDLNDAETEEAGLMNRTFEEPQGGLHRTALDVFHQIHCLDMIRKSFYPEYYIDQKHDVNVDDPKRLRELHRDHCIDYIRQALMCHADATPVRLEWDHVGHSLIPKFDQPHTCRNFELLHAWGRARAEEKYHDESKKRIKELTAQGVL